MIIQWYPGHIAKAEKALMEQLNRVDVVFEVRDARIPLATHHPSLQGWLAKTNTPVDRVLVLNRMDNISPAARETWTQWFRDRGETPYFTDARKGKGVKAIAKAAVQLASRVNERRIKRGMKPRPIRAAVIGFPNVGKSALINRLLNKRVVESASKPGVTRQLRWVRISKELELLDAPGILPANLTDQESAAKLAICDDIGQAAYDNQRVASALVDSLKALDLDHIEGTNGSDGTNGNDEKSNQNHQALEGRYGVSPSAYEGDTYLIAIAENKYQGDVERSARSLLQDFRKGSLGTIALEIPPKTDGDAS